MIESKPQQKSTAIPEDGFSLAQSSYRYVITGFEYRWFCGAAIPYILYNGELGDGAFPLMGYHSFAISQERRCTNCLCIIDERESLCQDCRELDLFKRLRCILDGPGVPFEKDCTQENPACCIPAWASSVCYSNWILYIASVFGIPKVGISRMNKDGCSMGFTKRLLSQGAESWVVFGPIKGLQTALDFETKFADEYSYTMSVPTQEKWNQLNRGTLRYELPVRELGETAKQYGLNIFLEGDFSECYSLCDDLNAIEFSEVSNGLEGFVVSNYGPLVGFDKEGSIRMYSIEKSKNAVILGGI